VGRGGKGTLKVVVIVVVAAAAKLELIFEESFIVI
jgi:hypothetical protein